MAEQPAAATGCGKRWPLTISCPSSASVLPPSSPFGRSFMAKLVRLPSMAWEWGPVGAQGCDSRVFHKTRQKLYFSFYFFCTVLLDVQHLPAWIWPFCVLRLGCMGWRAGQHPACSGANLLPNPRSPGRAGRGRQPHAQGTQPVHAGCPALPPKGGCGVSTRLRKQSPGA